MKLENGMEIEYQAAASILSFPKNLTEKLLLVSFMMRATGPTSSSVPSANYVPVYVMLPVSHRPCHWA